MTDLLPIALPLLGRILFTAVLEKAAVISLGQLISLHMLSQAVDAESWKRQKGLCWEMHVPLPSSGVFKLAASASSSQTV